MSKFSRFIFSSGSGVPADISGQNMKYRYVELGRFGTIGEATSADDYGIVKYFTGEILLFVNTGSIIMGVLLNGS